MHAMNNAPTVMNWFKFFQDERELWLQNISATQISMQFEIAPGHVAGVLAPIGMDPICITNEVPFDAVKKSLDFRKILNRVPSVMKLLTTEQAHAYYNQKAASLNAYITDPATGKSVPNVQAAIEYAEIERKKLTTKQNGDDTVISPDGQVHFAPPKSAQELMNLNVGQHMGVPPAAAQAAGLPQSFVNAPAGFDQTAAAGQMGGFANMGHEPVMMEQIINPRVLYLCQQVSMQLDANLRMPAEQFFREIRSLEPVLKLEDLQHIESYGTYKTVKKWARDFQAKLVASGQGDGIEDGLEPSPMATVPNI